MLNSLWNNLSYLWLHKDLTWYWSILLDMHLAWLVNGLLLHARERQREMRKAARDGAGGECGGCGCATPCEVGLEPSAFERFERAWSRALLGDACSLAERELVAEGDADAWEVFRRHFLDGMEYADIGLQLRITAAEARTRARRAHDLGRQHAAPESN